LDSSIIAVHSHNETEVRRLVGFVIVLVLTICTLSVSLPQENPTSWEVHFSPNGGCTDAIVRELVKAQNNVLVQAYSFTSYKIAKGLRNAQKRGVKVKIILDKSQVVSQDALIRLLIQRGLLTKEKFLETAKVVDREGQRKSEPGM
jgi:phosphatidylserine/phosphatidylglycerophosphate/cardiolipin synthase-like enzyme